MKINIEDVRKMIIQELNDLVSTQDDPEKALNSYKSSSYDQYANAIRGNAAAMVKVLGMHDDLERKSLVDFRDRVIPDLHLAIDSIKSKIDAMLESEE